jgi:alpha-L-fucosidase
MARMFSIMALCLAMLSVSVFSASAQPGYVPSEGNLKAREAFEDMRFGVFIHWGIYSMFAQGEWYLNNGKLSAEEYMKAAGGFYPSRFDAREWVKAIKASGAKYITITSRHHDGFSMFSTATSEYDIVDGTPFKRDIIGELAQACHEEGIALHFYYSLLDWVREDYPIGGTGRDTGRKGNAPDYESYRAFMKTQLTELLTQYGKIGAIWFDGHWDHKKDLDWRYDDLYSHIHGIDPSCLIGNNHHIAPIEGEDFQMFERDLPGENNHGWADNQTISALPLEMCQTMNGMWGYKVADQNYKSVPELVRLIVKAASKGSNLLLNIGPQPDGCLPALSLDRLAGIGEWMSKYGESVYGTSVSGLAEQEWGVTTRRDNELYLHVFKPVEGDKIEIDFPADASKKMKVLKVQALKDGSYLPYQFKKGHLSISLPACTACDACAAVSGASSGADIDYVVKVVLK